MAESVNGTLSYLLSDPVLGSVSASLNTSGAVTATQLYSPYGGVRSQSGMLPTDYGFTHQRSDASTSGLDDYGARYYDPVAGQFTSADTTLAGGLNRYGYVAGSPETYIDPSGHSLREGAGGEGGGLSGGDGTVGGGQSSGDSWGGSGDPGGSVSGLPPSMTVGDELTYDAGSAGANSFHLDAAGNVDGVEGSDGQLLETNAQIEAQQAADSQDRLSQGEQPQEPPTTANDGEGERGTSSKPLTKPSQQLRDAIRQNWQDQNAQWNARDSIDPEGGAPTMGTVVYEGAYTETSGPIIDTDEAGHAEAQGAAQAASVIQDLVDTGVEGEIQVTVISGNPPCVACQRQFPGWAQQIQDPARGSNLTVNVQFVGQWTPGSGLVSWFTFPW